MCSDLDIQTDVTPCWIEWSSAVFSVANTTIENITTLGLTEYECNASVCVCSRVIKKCPTVRTVPECKSPTRGCFNRQSVGFSVWLLLHCFISVNKWLHLSLALYIYFWPQKSWGSLQAVGLLAAILGVIRQCFASQGTKRTEARAFKIQDLSVILKLCIYDTKSLLYIECLHFR